MREVLFRAKQIDTNEWVFGYPVRGVDCCHAAWMMYIPAANPDENNRTVFIDENTLGIWTGLQDENGKKIFHGDIGVLTVFDHEGQDNQYKVEAIFDDVCGLCFNEVPSRNVELTKAIMKIRRVANDYEKTPAALNNLLEETADVDIMVDQLKIMWGPKQVEEYRRKKLERLAHKLAGEAQSTARNYCETCIYQGLKAACVVTACDTCYDNGDNPPSGWREFR